MKFLLLAFLFLIPGPAQARRNPKIPYIEIDLPGDNLCAGDPTPCNGRMIGVRNPLTTYAIVYVRCDKEMPTISDSALMRPNSRATFILTTTRLLYPNECKLTFQPVKKKKK